MADCNRVPVNPDFFDQQAYDSLPLGDIERVSACAKFRAEIGEGLAQVQIAGPIDRGRFDRLPLGREGLLLRAKRGHPRAQFLQRDQLVLIRRDQAIHRRRHPDLLPREVVDALPRGIALARHLPPPREFPVD